MHRDITRAGKHTATNGIRALIVLIAVATAAMRPTMAASDSYAAVIANPIRTDQDRRMDASRHPAQFLAFVQAKPGMKVLDISAGGGYTTQLLALAIAPEGTVFAQTPRPGETLTKRLAEHPQPNVVLAQRPFEDPVPADAPKLDLVTLVNNYHDLTYQPIDRAAMNAKIFAALKPGGHYVVIDHSAQSGTGISAGKTLHRIDEQVVRSEVEKAGFKLEAEGNFLRNSADMRDDSSNSPKVPTDRFALRFVKP